jgi:hypothetical protein
VGGNGSALANRARETDRERESERAKKLEPTGGVLVHLLTTRAHDIERERERERERARAGENCR